MSRQINQPINQVKLTNVAVVRCNKAGKRFEIACYRNKVMDYRSGLEKDLSEVLQSERIFTNCSKGQFAKSADLQKAFGTTDEEEIAKIILKEGKSVQVSDLERNHQIQSTVAQIASWVASNCVHPDHGRPYTVSQIKHALGKNFTVQTHKPLKKQCLDAVKFLKNVIPIERAKMELSIQYPPEHDETVNQTVQRLEQCTVVTEKCKPPPAEPSVMVVQVDPSLYRELDELCKTLTGAHLEILQQVVSVEGGDVDLDKELERKQMQLAANQVKGTKGVKKASTVEQVADDVEKLNLSADDASNSSSNDEHSGVGSQKGKDVDDDDDDDDDADLMLVDRKTQKKAAKKAKKARRRMIHDQEEDEEPRESVPDEAETSQPAAANNKTTDGSSEPPAGSKSCNTCGGAFLSTADYRAHFRSDWHRFNQKLKLKGQTPVTEEEFKLCDAETFFGQFDA